MHTSETVTTIFKTSPIWSACLSTISLIIKFAWIKHPTRKKKKIKIGSRKSHYANEIDTVIQNRNVERRVNAFDATQRRRVQIFVHNATTLDAPCGRVGRRLRPLMQRIAGRPHSNEVELITENASGGPFTSPALLFTGSFAKNVRCGFVVSMRPKCPSLHNKDHVRTDVVVVA